MLHAASHTGFRLVPRRSRAIGGAVVSAAVLAGCGGGHGAAGQSRTASPAAVARAAAVCVPRTGSDLAAPGPFRVRTTHGTLVRRDTGGSLRRIDPTIWYPLGRSRCRLPLVLLSHGVHGAPGRYAPFAAHLASQGFVVLGPHHPDREAEGADEGAERVADLTFLLDHLGTVERRLAPQLEGAIDGRRVGVLGHSFGAYAAGALAAEDRRVVAVMGMAGGTDPGTAAAIHAPTLAVAGGSDHLVPVAHVQAFADALPASTPHGFMDIAAARHTSFRCADVRVCGLLERTASAFFFTYLARVPGATAPLDPARVGGPGVSLTTVGMPPR
jgi:predicted dienelactone hydrolase